MAYFFQPISATKWSTIEQLTSAVEIDAAGTQTTCSAKSNALILGYTVLKKNAKKEDYGMYERFKSRAEGVSAEVYRFATKAAALEYIVQFFRDEGVADTPQSYATWADCEFLRGIDRKQLTGIPGVKFDVTRSNAADSKIGISQVEWALADTGTLVQDSSAVEQRLVSSLPEIHIVLVPSGNILADLPSLLPRLTPKNSRYIAMITGASRTADIERVLTIGVHGPERLIIVFVDELGGSN